jgi:hypothetical protein
LPNYDDELTTNQGTKVFGTDNHELYPVTEE